MVSHLLHSMAFGLCGDQSQHIAADSNESFQLAVGEPYVVTCTGTNNMITSRSIMFGSKRLPKMLPLHPDAVHIAARSIVPFSHVSQIRVSV